MSKAKEIVDMVSEGDSHEGNLRVLRKALSDIRIVGKGFVRVNTPKEGKMLKSVIDGLKEFIAAVK